MSIKMMSLVWDSKLPRDEKFVLLAYADHADDDGRNIFPAVATVARKTGYSIRSVQTITRKLEKSKILISDSKGPKGTNRWRMNKKNLVNYTPAKSAPRKKPRKPPAKTAPKSSFNHPYEKKDRNHHHHSLIKQNGHNDDDDPAPSPALQNIFEKWTNCGFTLNAPARKALREALDKYPLGWVQEVIGRMAGQEQIKFPANYLKKCLEEESAKKANGKTTEEEPDWEANRAERKRKAVERWEAAEPIEEGELEAQGQA